MRRHLAATALLIGTAALPAAAQTYLPGYDSGVESTINDPAAPSGPDIRIADAGSYSITVLGESPVPVGADGLAPAPEAAWQRFADHPLAHRSAEEVIGRDVVDPAGREIGAVADLVVDRNLSLYAVVEVEAGAAPQKREVLVPFERLQPSRDAVGEPAISANLSGPALASLPEYETGRYSPLTGKG
jgi:sporulation protein YlmC with PRC-barrel domain